jgi:hypothetical protein
VIPIENEHRVTASAKVEDWDNPGFTAYSDFDRAERANHYTPFSGSAQADISATWNDEPGTEFNEGGGATAISAATQQTSYEMANDRVLGITAGGNSTASAQTAPFGEAGGNTQNVGFLRFDVPAEGVGFELSLTCTTTTSGTLPEAAVSVTLTNARASPFRKFASRPTHRLAGASG